MCIVLNKRILKIKEDNSLFNRFIGVFEDFDVNQYGLLDKI